MEIERSGQHELSAEEQAHLKKLRQLVESALADGKFSEAELQSVRAMIHADNQVTPEELRTIRSTVREMLGDAALEYDWS
ncbi:hypothetical protein [Leptolyngbya iicbica]|uniref:Uncharacterized protein n=2 Tax=Cyanophyceae TaxID=3028117 RepID=A0A4Q7E6H9_9CYAN|nr:hypothetical protein [Leptolyngbya sp. LK]RZM77861.1 hypothetical protein DYY88_14945 [Leptolyngbya sp. LK]